MSAKRSGSIARWFWLHPEWWSLACSVAAWMILVTERHHHAPRTFAGNLFDWLLMVLAMMLPLIVEPIRITATRSFWNRRHRAIATFLIGYVAPWMLFGLAIGAIGTLARVAVLDLDMRAVPMDMRAVPLVAMGVIGAGAAAWQLTGIKRRALIECHRTVPLAPRGWPATRDCAGYGYLIGTRCLIACGPLMVLCVIIGHSLLAIVGLTALMFAERSARRPDRVRRLTGLLLGIATGLAVFAIR